MRTTITTVLFDADGVIHRPPPFHARLERAFGITEAEVHECVRDIFGVEGDALIGKADYAVALADVLRKWGRGCSAKAFFTHWHTFEVDYGVLSLVRELRSSGIYCALASNQERHRARVMSEDLKYANHFDSLFYSFEVGHRKPDVEYFHQVILRGGLDPASTLFLDDLEVNVEAARAAGLKAAQFELPSVGSGEQEMRALLATFDI